MAERQENMGIIWENKPAEEWMEAYPLGNGRMGAMVFGGIAQEQIQLNLDSLCYGGHVDRINPDARENLGLVRQLILTGKIEEAEALMVRAFSGTPQSQRPYQPLGNLEIQYRGSDAHGAGQMNRRSENGTVLLDASKAKNYRRELDLDHGAVTESYTMAETTIRKRCFVSFPDQLTVLHIKVEGDAALSASMILRRSRFYESAGRLNDHAIFMKGQAGPDGVRFYATVSAIADGDVHVIGEHLILEHCKEICLLIAGETNFRGDDPERICADRTAAAEAHGYAELRARHEADYGALYSRVRFHLRKETNMAGVQYAQPFSEQLRMRPEEPEIAEAYFNFGRALMIMGSRPGSLPLNLQGIWNESYVPAWDSKYTININTEMNYWPAESLNLSECHLPLFELIQRMREDGKSTARRMYGCRGFVAHHNTDIWADTAPQDIYIPSTYWVMGAAWLCTHIMTHYRYTKDIAFLKLQYPCLQDAVRFFMDFLMEDKNELLICPSVSPENTYIMKNGTRGCACASSTMDTEILRDLLNDYLQASELLCVHDDMTEWAAESIGKLPKFQIGKHGQLMEWREDYDEQEPGHRHISHLYALYPSAQIDREDTPSLADAAEKTIARRLAHGGGYTGWSCAWIICMYARLGRGEDAYQNLLKLLRESTSQNLMDTHPMKRGPVFQIDGNLGAVAGIAEMLVQSAPGRLRLLSALPAAWKGGSIEGIRLMDGAELKHLVWENGEVVQCEICAGMTAYEAAVSANGKTWQVQIPAGVTARIEI